MQLPNAEQRQFFEQATAQYQRDLAADTAAQAYLTGRGIAAQVAQQFRLGVQPNPLLGHERYRGRLSIPYLTPSGVVTFSFRCISHAGPCEEHPKYLASEGFDRTLYNVLDFKKPSDKILVVEGEMDAITWSMSGWPTIGVPGVKNFKDQFARCFNEYAEVFAICDGDDPGYKLGSFLAREIRARVIRLPRGEDGNSLYVKEGRDGLQRVLNVS